MLLQRFLDQARPVFESFPLNGYYIDSCQIHCQTLYDVPWSTFTISNSSMRETFTHWYNDKSGEVDTRRKDCEVPYNCDPSCSAHNVETKGNPLNEQRVF